MLANQDMSAKRGETLIAKFALQDSTGTAFELDDVTGATVTWMWGPHEFGPATASVNVTPQDDGNGKAEAQVTVPTSTVGIFFHQLKMFQSGEKTNRAKERLKIQRNMGPPA